MVDEVNNPVHYECPFEVTDIQCRFINRYLAPALSNAFKYVWRAGNKGTKEDAIKDLDKALNYIRDQMDYEVAHPNIQASQAIFSLFHVPDGDDLLTAARYDALSDLLDENYRDAIEDIYAMLEIIKGDSDGAR